MPKIDIIDGKVNVKWTKHERNGQLKSQAVINKLLDVKRRNPKITENELMLLGLAERNRY